MRWQRYDNPTLSDALVTQGIEREGWHILAKQGRGLRALAGLLILASIMATPLACDRDQESSSAKETGTSVTASADGITLTLSIDRLELNTDQESTVTVSATAPEGIDVQLNDYDEIIKEKELAFELRVRPLDSPKRSSDAQGTLRQLIRRYTLSPVLPGDYTLPAGRLSYRLPASADADEDESATTEPKTLETETIELVATAVGEAAPSEEELARIDTLDPRELPTVWSRWWWVWPAGILVLLIAAFLLLPRLRRAVSRWWQRRQERPAPVIPAHEWARGELNKLVAANLIERNLIQEFYYRLSYIVRGYIERRYDVTAGEMTTEEFLAAAVSDARFGPEITEELQRFMTASDLVKYAAQPASKEESEEAIRAAESLVERTRARSETETTAQGQAA